MFTCSVNDFSYTIAEQMKIENTILFALNLHKTIFIKYNKLCTKTIQEKHINIEDANNTNFNK